MTAQRHDLRSLMRFPAQGLERKVFVARWTLFFEALWPRLWLALAVALLFILVSLAGVWPFFGTLWHKVLLGVFAATAAAALYWLARTPWPERAAALRRLEQDSGVPHRPASSYEDRLAPEQSSPTTVALWRAHQARLQGLLARLRVSLPRPHVDRYDPLALRTLLVLTVLVLTLLAGESATDRLLSAFRIEAPPTAAGLRLDAWVAPPAYTGKPPVMLLDGGQPGKAVGAAGSGAPLEVPERSVFSLRGSGPERAGLALSVTGEDGTTEEIAAKPAGASSDVMEAVYEVTRPVTLSVYTGRGTHATFAFTPIPDRAPRIALTKDPEPTARGGLKLTYKVDDDYGVNSAQVRFSPVPAAPDPAKAWAQITLKGPRLPPERPPQTPLHLPRSNAREAEGYSYIESSSHAWAGREVIMTLEASDQAGQTGRSAPVKLILPMRRFEKPLARAVVEQRRKLAEDSRMRPFVLTALEALTLEPEGFITDGRVYLGLRSAYHRLRGGSSREVLKSVMDQLWHVALRIEDGDLSEVERSLRDIQERLSKALEEGASDQEIKNLMNELREAMNRYMEQLMRQAENMPDNGLQGLNSLNSIISPQDLDRMMRELENMARNGSREQAQQMLSELRDLMENMRVGRMSEEQMQQSRRMMEMMSELGGIVGDQQKLMDDTFGEQRQQEGGAPNGGGKGGQSRQNPRQPGGDGGQAGKGSQGKGLGGTEGTAEGSLSGRQGELRQRLEKLERELENGGAGKTGKLGSAREAMGRAEQALREGDYATATEEQARALDELRQGAQSMAQQLLRASPRHYGQAPGPGETLLDPLGRPQRTEGSDVGKSVKIPDEIDMQRAREILEELRRRLGETRRAPDELEYIERLLQRY